MVERSASLTLEGDARIAVVADTHSRPHPRTAELLRAAKPTAILHAGDIGDDAVLESLAEHAPVLAVRGNIDSRGGRAGELPDVLLIDVASPLGTLRIYLTHIAVHGPKLRGEVAARAREAGAQMVVCGHSHVPFIGRDRGLTVFNPGSIGPRRFDLPIVFGTIEVTATALRLAHVSCETGGSWSPP
jgi:putative phosphoesterase